MLISMVKCVSFIKTPLFIFEGVNGLVKWLKCNKKNNKWCVDIIKEINNLIQRKIVKMTHNLRWRKHIQSKLSIYWKLKIEVFFSLPFGSNLEFHHKYTLTIEVFFLSFFLLVVN